MLGAWEASEKVIDFDGKPIRGKTADGYRVGYDNGADAVVVALRGSSESLMKADVSGVFRTLFSKMTLRGMWVFIPDEKA